MNVPCGMPLPYIAVGLEDVVIAPLFVELEFVKTIVAALMSPLDTPKSDAGLDTGSTIALLVVVLGGAGDALVGRDV